jgi:hypothetical protein
MRDLFLIIGAIVFIVVVLVAFSVLMAIPTYYLWNWLAPTLFGLKEITLAQAWGLNMLSGILFKSSYRSKSSD